MLKFILVFLVSILLVFFAGPFLPFWGLMIGVALIGFAVGGHAGAAFLGGALAFGIAWLAISLTVSIKTGSDLPDKMAILFGVPNSSLLWIITALLGFVIGGFSAITGNLLRKLYIKKEYGIYRG